jgi:hypothetical protein
MSALSIGPRPPDGDRRRVLERRIRWVVAAGLLVRSLSYFLST